MINAQPACGNEPRRDRTTHFAPRQATVRKSRPRGVHSSQEWSIFNNIIRSPDTQTSPPRRWELPSIATIQPRNCPTSRLRGCGHLITAPNPQRLLGHLGQSLSYPSLALESHGGPKPTTRKYATCKEAQTGCHGRCRPSPARSRADRQPGSRSSAARTSSRERNTRMVAAPHTPGTAWNQYATETAEDTGGRGGAQKISSETRRPRGNKAIERILTI